MTGINDFFDPAYITGATTEAEKKDQSNKIELVKELIPKLETKNYGGSKPTRVIIRGRIAKW